MNSKKEHLGHKIKRLRAFRGMTQEELASKLGKTRSLVSFFERTGSVNKYTLSEICSILETSPEVLQGDIMNDDGGQPDYNPPKIDAEIVQQLKEENKFLKETVNNQWQLLHELSKRK